MTTIGSLESIERVLSSEREDWTTKGKGDFNVNTRVIGICVYLRTTDIVIDYFISFHSSHIVPIHLTGSHIEHTATLILATTSVFVWWLLKLI